MEGTEKETNGSEPSSAIEYNPILTELLSYFDDKLQKLSAEVNQHSLMIENNPPIPTAEQDDHSDKVYLLRYRVRMLNCLIEQLKKQPPQEWTWYPLHVKSEVEKSLKKEVKDLKSLLHYNKKQLEEDKEKLEKMTDVINKLKAMMQERDENPVDHQIIEASLTDKQRKLDLMFKQHKKKLNGMLLELFPTGYEEIRSVLQDVCESYFSKEDGDPYIEIKTDEYKTVEMLLEADIIVRHPTNKNMIRLANFVE